MLLLRLADTTPTRRASPPPRSFHSRRRPAAVKRCNQHWPVCRPRLIRLANWCSNWWWRHRAAEAAAAAGRGDVGQSDIVWHWHRETVRALVRADQWWYRCVVRQTHFNTRLFTYFTASIYYRQYTIYQLCIMQQKSVQPRVSPTWFTQQRDSYVKLNAATWRCLALCLHLR